MEGHELADSYVFNPHKWMFTNFDCTIMYLKEPQYLVNTFSMTPEYLKTKLDEEVNNYRDWGIPLGRRFRALKLWFVIRSYGLEGIRAKIRNHIQLAHQAKSWIEAHDNLEILAPVNFNTICFRYQMETLSLEQENLINESWMNRVNTTGKAFFSHTKLDGKYVIRWVISQTDVNEKHIQNAWSLLLEQLHETINDI
jgi:aromatic-L-amino-acid decarboxylase